MKFFVDSADPSEILACAREAIIDGVSVGGSPTAGRETLIDEICGIFPGPVNVEIGDRQDGMREGPKGGSEAASEAELLSEARGLARISSNVVVELPFTEAVLKVVHACAAEGIKTNVTRCSSPVQALRAAQAGAAYVSPFGDRQEDSAGLDLVRKIVAAYKTYGIATEVLVVSVRSVGEVLDAVLAGAQIATVPYPVLRQIIEQRR
jgi:transaldolase